MSGDIGLKAQNCISSSFPFEQKRQNSSDWVLNMDMMHASGQTTINDSDYWRENKTAENEKAIVLIMCEHTSDSLI